MKVYNKIIDLKTNKDIKDTKIACFSDLHYTKSFTKEKMSDIYNEISNHNPNYICFIGDLLDDNSLEDIYKYIKYFSFIAPTILIDGNHDIRSFIVNDKIHDNKYHVLTDEFKNELNNLNNVYYLNDNASIHFGNISFTGTNFYHKTCEDDNIEFLNNFVPNIKENNYNILLCHSPYIIKKETFDKINAIYKNYDIAFTGHIHNALMPAYIDKMFKKNIGLFTVDDGLFPSDYLGEKEIKLDQDKTLTRINIPPITSFNPNKTGANTVNKLYPPSIRLVRIKKN